MSTPTARLAPIAEAPLARLLAEPALAREFDVLAAPGELARAFHDPMLVADASALLVVNDEPIAFCLAAVVPQASGLTRGFLRLGVAEAHRRHGHGSRLLAHATARLEALEGARLERVDTGAWTPAPAAEAFVVRHGFRVARHFWRLMRPLVPVPDATPPRGITVRAFDGRDAAYRDLAAVHNDAFAEHWGFVPAEDARLRAWTGEPGFDPACLRLAYRDGACVGYCWNDRVGDSGVISMLGVARAARGIGLGRALLRGGIAYAAARGARDVGLLVDGANEEALALYRSEGFEVTRTRTVWERPVPR